MRFGGMLAAALITLLAACGSGSDQPAPKEPTTASSTAPAPTATVPTMPAQAAEDSPAGASAFVAHYVQVFNYAAATGDVAELSRLSSPDCDGCQRYIDRFEEIYNAGDRISETLWTLSDADVVVREQQVTAEIVVNEGSTTQYTFNFALPSSAPYIVQGITRKVDS